MTLEDRLTDRVRDRLPDDRELVPEELEPVARDVDAQGVSSVQYSDDSGESAVAILFLWFEQEQAALSAERPGGRWQMDVTTPVSLEDFERAVRALQAQPGAQRRGPTTLETDDGHVRELREDR